MPIYCRLEDFFSFDVVKKILRSVSHRSRSTENWVLHRFGRHVVRPGTMPHNLGMADWEFEPWTGSNMGSSDLEFGLETGLVKGMADPEFTLA